ncbi:MAG: ribonuclease [Lachnospiraceae bacterium]|nr:ribonuclease [Lachnospiraceae bacterium]
MVCLSLLGCSKKSKKAVETTGYDVEIVTMPKTTEAIETTREAEPTTEATTVALTTVAPTTAPTTVAPTTVAPTTAAIDENGTYTSKEDVALYIHTYGKLPKNYITKSEAENLGWISSKGNLGRVAPGKSIGGDRFGNYEGQLPKARGRSYTECDIDFDGGYRNSKRIIFSNDGLIFYTEDHYETFEQLYP